MNRNDQKGVKRIEKNKKIEGWVDGVNRNMMEIGDGNRNRK